MTEFQSKIRTIEWMGTYSKMVDQTKFPTHFEYVDVTTGQQMFDAIKTMIKMAGAPEALYDNLNVDAFIEQAESFKLSKMGVMNKIVEKISIMDNAAPWMVRRASELLKWYKSSDYDAIIKKYGV